MCNIVSHLLCMRAVNDNVEKKCLAASVHLPPYDYSHYTVNLQVHSNLLNATLHELISAAVPAALL